MKIHVFTTTEESWESGNLNNREVKYFSNAEVRDDYFKNVLRPKYSENEELVEYKENSWQPQRGGGWGYYLEKGETDIEIIDTKTW
jgi:hypothetical protein